MEINLIGLHKKGEKTGEKQGEKKGLAMRQKNLIDVPMDEVGKKAKEFYDMKEVFRKTKDDLDKTEQDLIVAMHDNKRQRITIDGVTFYVKLIASKEKIQIN
jgi:phage pi2 protein 07